MDTNAANALLDMMRGVIDKGTGRAIRSTYGIRADVAGKTGTTQGNADGWFILMHPQLVAGAWAGFNDGRITLRSDYWGQGARSACPWWATSPTACWAPAASTPRPALPNPSTATGGAIWWTVCANAFKAGGAAPPRTKAPCRTMPRPPPPPGARAGRQPAGHTVHACGAPMPGGGWPGWEQRPGGPAPVTRDPDTSHDGPVEERTPTLQEQGLPAPAPAPVQPPRPARTVPTTRTTCRPCPASCPVRRTASPTPCHHWAADGG
jgi:penicillin-binding protein 1A